MRTDELALDYIERAEITFEDLRALRDAEEVLEICKRLIKKWKSF